ncbi:hypothetical protein K435DRAFT_845273 [Dendrothele bispora CBS 962.96]|uniref:Uncharacterized protein n=1 Tax=Dendrothele bispora (strain CBS 962.96) TaxID=1314807 RepID=A0A4S8KVT0_DENBC|nr:hypothetical protein K435DRAFT_845273 [Dendrothele bispora CBS 962.96]
MEVKVTEGPPIAVKEMAITNHNNGTPSPMRHLFEPYHPSDIINKYLLEENLDSQVAMTHDSTWIEALDDDDDLMPNEEELIARIKRRYKIEKSDDGKCVFLMPAADNESLAGTKKTSSLEVERASDYSTLDDREDEDTELEKVINMSLDQALAETTSNTSLNTAEQAKLEQAFVLSTPSSDDFYEAVPRLTSDRLAEHTEPYSVLRSVLLDRDHVIHIDRQANQFSNGRVIENTRPTEGSTGGAAKPTDGSTGGAAKPTEGSMGGAAKPTEGSTGGAVKPGRAEEAGPGTGGNEEEEVGER